MNTPPAVPEPDPTPRPEPDSAETNRRRMREALAELDEIGRRIAETIAEVERHVLHVRALKQAGSQAAVERPVERTIRLMCRDLGIPLRGGWQEPPGSRVTPSSVRPPPGRKSPRR